jgi:glyoxylase-like metal-dependent hydrolase (beta-lactamase superfamily II)
MHVHHLSCGTMCPWGGRLMYGPADDPALRRLVCHCLLIETDSAGLVLVDTGFGVGDVRRARERLSRFFLFANRPQLHDEHTALRQIEALGLKAADVRHIVLTHLDFDHAGGIEDFPHATVHVLAQELTAATSGRRGFIARNRYRPQQWDDGVVWQRHSFGGERWMGFDCVRDMPGLPPEILMVPLVGHTWGHCGVAIERQGGWLLHAGDAYFHRGELDLERYRCPPGLRGYQAMMEVDRRARLLNQRRLRDLVAQGEAIDVFCAHDPGELATRRTAVRAPALVK